MACMETMEMLKNFDGEQPKLTMIDDEAKAEALLRLLDRTVGTEENAIQSLMIWEMHLSRCEKSRPISLGLQNIVV